MSSSPRRSGSNKKSSSSSPLLNSLLRTAVSALASDPKSDRHSSSSRSPHPEPGHLPRSHTQPEFRRQGDYDPAAGIPSHTTPSTSKDHTFDLLKTAAYELGKLVHDVEGKLRSSDKDKYRPEGIRNDSDRFEEISDDNASTRHRSGGSSRRRGRSADSGRHRERHRGGHADDYYGDSAAPAPQGQFGYGDYTQQFNPAAQTHSYPYPPPGPQQQQHLHLNHNDNSYTHPMPSPQPMYSDSDRPKLKRSKTSASKIAGDMGGELMKNLPALLDKAAWLLSLLEKKNATSRGGSSAGHSALLMALGLVMELYRNLGGAETIRSYNEKRALKKERGMRAEERYERY